VGKTFHRSGRAKARSRSGRLAYSRGPKRVERDLSEPQARQHENGHRAEGWSASSPDTDLKDRRFNSIALGLIREEGQSGSVPLALLDELFALGDKAAVKGN
jgi:hypothetical protein